MEPGTLYPPPAEPQITKYTEIKVTFVIGGPGSGKGTICKNLALEQNAYHLSVGDYLRELSNSDLKDGPAFGMLGKEKLIACLSNHELVPAEHVVAILWHKIGVERDNEFAKFLIDGFPRDEASGWQFEQALTKHSCSEVDRVILFDCPKEVCKKRFLSRQRQTTDTDDVFEKRWNEFEAKNKEVMQRYRKHVVTVDSRGSAELTMAFLCKALGLK